MRRAPSTSGMTILEILIVLGLIGVLMVALSSGIGRMRKTDLRGDSGRFAAAVRSAFDRASATGAHHRIVLDLDQETYQLQRCEGQIKLHKSAGEAVADDRAELEAEIKKLVAEAQAAVDSASGTPTEATPAEAPEDGEAQPDAPAQAASTVGAASCAPIAGDQGKLQTLKKKRGIGFATVSVPHLDEPAREGQVSLHFFPQGYAERAVVAVEDADRNTFSVVVHPITGRVQLLAGAYRDPEEFVAADAEGNQGSPP